MVRPSTEDFNKIVSVIESGGNFQQYQGWGGFALKYGGYYGHGTIQGTKICSQVEIQTNWVESSALMR